VDEDTAIRRAGCTGFVLGVLFVLLIIGAVQAWLWL
jgi:hypothetical protein